MRSKVGISLAVVLVMKIYSLIKDQYHLRPIEVEVSCIPGSPHFEIIGQADTGIKESKYKVYSALRNQGFEVPAGKKVFVNLKPSHIKKSSQGIDLAIALGLLWQTGQLLKPNQEKVLVYGELGLEGDVQVPEDLTNLTQLPDGFTEVYTGEPSQALGFDLHAFPNLKAFPCINSIPRSANLFEQIPPPVEEIYLPAGLAKLVWAIAWGEHPCLFAGPRGSGKSTIVESISKLVRPLSSESFAELKQIANFFRRSIQWRPVVAPHHTTTPIAMVGGGSHAFPGEFTRSHGGVLIMDEFLEFHPSVQEALREPMQTGKINISRMGGVKEHPAQFMLLATTNLCPCGEYFPSKKNRCYCRSSSRRRYIEKLSGPVLDRFHILSFSDDWIDSEDVFLPDLAKDLRSRQQELNKEDIPNSRRPLDALVDLLSERTSYHRFDKMKISRRRKLACIQLAKSFADYERSPKIEEEHINLAMEYSFRSFENFRVSMSKEL